MGVCFRCQCLCGRNYRLFTKIAERFNNGKKCAEKRAKMGGEKKWENYSFKGILFKELFQVYRWEMVNLWHSSKQSKVCSHAADGDKCICLQAEDAMVSPHPDKGRLYK